jgi:hypothetical protein
MHNIATTQEASVSGAGVTAEDWKDLVGLGLGTVLSAPGTTNEGWLGGINTTGGGAWTLTVTGNVKLGATWQATLTFTGAGSWAYMKSVKYNNNFRWVVVGSSGVT